MRTTTHERGTAAVELAVFLPVMVFMAAAAVTVVRTVLTYAQLTELSKAGARYATRAALDPTNPGAYRLRPTAGEVESFVRRIGEGRVSSVAVSPDPATSHPGTLVTVRVTSHLGPGPLGRALALVNLFAGIFGADPPFPADGLDLTSTAVMREE